MTPQDLLAALRRSGIEVTAVGDRLRVEAPRGAVTDEIRQALVEHKPELLAELAGESGWPPECRQAERRFGARHARLFPLLGCRVVTPNGPGELVQVFAERAAVRLDADLDRLAFFQPHEIRPPGAAPGDRPFPTARLH